MQGARVRSHITKGRTNEVPFQQDMSVGKQRTHCARLPLCRLCGACSSGGFSTAASALETNLGVNYLATGFYVESDSFDPGPQPTGPNGQALDPETEDTDSDNGFAQLLRIKADLRDEKTGIEVHTSLEVSGDRFSGQDRPDQTITGRQAFNTNSNGDNVRLDQAFIDVPFDYFLLRLGRQESNWNNCFLVCDDRRDRALLLTSAFGVVPFFAYDRTSDNTGFNNQGNGDEIFTGVIAPIGDWELGFLYVHFFNNFSGDLVDTDPALIDTDGDGVPDSAVPGSTGTGPRNINPQSNLNIVSPYVQGSLGPVKIATGANYAEGNNVRNNVTPESGDIFTDSAWSEYFRVGIALDIFELNAQYVGTQDGGLVDAGFDTYSSLINSNPDATNRPTSVYRMGGFNGREGFDEDLFIGSVTVNVNDKWSLRGAVGSLDIDAGNAGSDSSTVVDFESSYQINDILRTWATLGMLEENDVGVLSGNSLIGSLPNDGSFAADRVIAGAVYLGAEF